MLEETKGEGDRKGKVGGTGNEETSLRGQLKWGGLLPKKNENEKSKTLEDDKKQCSGAT